MHSVMTVRVQDGNITCYILELPIFILQEIFLRVAATDIVRCRCVCTAWHDILSEPDFCNLYTSSSKFRFFLYRLYTPRFTIRLLEVPESGRCSRRGRLIDLKLPEKLTTSKFHEVGSCNGLLCLLFYCYEEHRQIIHVVNPLTRNSVTLPECIWEKQESSGYPPEVKYVFGFNPSGNNFKVLRIEYIHKQRESSPYGFVLFMSACEIFTIGADDRWRSLSISSTYIPQTKIIAFSGAFSWIPWDKTPTEIPAFDLADEMLCQIQPPPNIILNDKSRLTVLHDQLSLVDLSDKSQVSIWVMRKYPAVESWTKTILLESLLPFDMYELYSWWPVARLNDVMMFFSNNSYGCHLISYNIDQGEARWIRIGNYVGLWAYTPNFLSSTRRSYNASQALTEQRICINKQSIGGSQ